MGNAFWLLLALPEWYFPTIISPLSAGPLTAIPALGIVCLIVGIGVAVHRRDLRPILFSLSALFSELLVGFAGLFRGQLREPTSTPILLGFLALQLILCGYLVHRLRGVRLAALALSIFAISYALFAMFIGGMSFVDDWV